MTDDDHLHYEDWAAALEDGDLLGQRCEDCGHETAAPKAACASCGSRALTTVDLPTAGVVYTETEIEVPPEDFDDDYHIAVVDLGEARLMAHVPATVDIGDDVTMDGVIEDGGRPAPVFVPR